jgi:hypothetical protein
VRTTPLGSEVEKGLVKRGHTSLRQQSFGQRSSIARAQRTSRQGAREHPPDVGVDNGDGSPEGETRDRRSGVDPDAGESKEILRGAGDLTVVKLHDGARTLDEPQGSTGVTQSAPETENLGD